jgi:hypothetical protein
MILVAAVLVMQLLLLLLLFVCYLDRSKGELILEKIAPLLNQLWIIQTSTRISSNGIDDSTTLAGDWDSGGGGDTFRGSS